MHRYWSPEMSSDTKHMLSPAKSDQVTYYAPTLQTWTVLAASARTFNLRGFIEMAEASSHSSGETPTKTLASSSSGCLFCGTVQNDSRKRTSLKGKVQDIAKRVAIVLDMEVTAVDVDRYLCNDSCYKRIKRIEKLQEEAKLLKNELKQSYASTNRFKRGVPSDSSLSPSTIVPAKSARPDQPTNTRQKVAKSLNFRSGSQIQEEREKCPVRNIMPLVALTVSSSRVAPPVSMVSAFVPIAANIISQGICEGNVCKVQVCTSDYLLYKLTFSSF